MKTWGLEKLCNYVTCWRPQVWRRLHEKQLKSRSAFASTASLSGSSREFILAPATFPVSTYHVAPPSMAQMTGPQENIWNKLHQSGLVGIWTFDTDPGGHRVRRWETLRLEAPVWHRYYGLYKKGAEGARMQRERIKQQTCREIARMRACVFFDKFKRQSK